MPTYSRFLLYMQVDALAYRRNSLIPSFEKEPRRMEYFIFLVFMTAIAG